MLKLAFPEDRNLLSEPEARVFYPISLPLSFLGGGLCFAESLGKACYKYKKHLA